MLSLLLISSYSLFSVHTDGRKFVRIYTLFSVHTDGNSEIQRLISVPMDGKQALIFAIFGPYEH